MHTIEQLAEKLAFFRCHDEILRAARMAASDHVGRRQGVSKPHPQNDT
jgi:hypothetical protein